jgi:hypothetical protein
MDLDWLTLIARVLMIAGAAALLVGRVTMAWPIAAIGLPNRKRGGLAELVDLIFLFDPACLQRGR